jgi:hypothetical protein
MSRSTTPLAYPIPKFNVGDVCIVIAGHRKQLIGREVTILSPLEYHEVDNRKNRYLGYAVDVFEDGLQVVFRGHHLKKKPLPKDFSETVSWDSVGWSPSKEIVQSLEGVGHDH